MRTLRWVALASALAAAACSVADSERIDPRGINAAAFVPVPTLCHSSLGSYALPKSFLKVVVTHVAADKPHALAVSTTVRADKALTFCLDHISDPMADDHIRVVKSSGQRHKSYDSPVAAEFAGEETADYGTQLLQWVVSNTVNQSEYIAKVLVRTVFTAISGKKDFTSLQRSGGRAETDAATLAVFEFDPFDPEQAALHNQRLRDFGYCLVLEKFAFDRREMSPEQYCGAPRFVPTSYSDAYLAYRSPPPPRIAGIAYRPRIQYALSIYRSEKPKGRGPWRLVEQKQLAFENIAPIVSVGLTRTIFAARRVALQFDRGALTAMCLVKSSELQGAVAIPYEIVRSIIALPTAVFEVKIGNIGDNIELLQAERQVVAAQQEYLDFLTDTSRVDGSPGKQTAEGLDQSQIPNPTTVTLTGIAKASMDTLQSSVLDRICTSAPGVIGE